MSFGSAWTSLVAPSPIITQSLPDGGRPALPNSLLDAASAGEITHSDLLCRQKEFLTETICGHVGGRMVSCLRGSRRTPQLHHNPRSANRLELGACQGS